MGFHFYADDTQLYLSFDSLSGEGQASAVHSIEACASEIDEWMRLNKLKLNSDKSELLVINFKYRPRPSLDSISISEQVVNSSVSARNLGLIVDDSLSLKEHVNSIYKSCYYHIRRIDLFTDIAAILNSIVSDVYYGILRGQIHSNVPPEHPIITI